MYITFYFFYKCFYFLLFIKFQLGQLAILGGGSCWLLIATLLKAPVSTTHSIIGATLGFALLMRGADGVQWNKILKISTYKYFKFYLQKIFIK